MAKKIDIEIGETYYCLKSYWDERCGSRYFSVTVTGENDRVWNCDNGTINKRSRMLTDGWKDKYKLLTKDEVMRSEWIGRWKREIVKQVDGCRDYEGLWLIADVLGIDAPLVEPDVDK